MSDLDELLAYWRAADRLFQNVEETWGGAVVSDRRYPRIHEANYALVQTAEPVHLDEIDGVLGPAARRTTSTLAWRRSTNRMGPSGRRSGPRLGCSGSTRTR